MMFSQFAQANGLVIRNLVDDGSLVRVPTASHPHKKNGAYRFCGDWGWVQDWANSEDPQFWFKNGINEIRKEEIKRDIQADMLAERKRQLAAAKRAQDIVSSCLTGIHPYLAKKGFKDELGLIDNSGMLVIPMRDSANYKLINSVQFIDDSGSKKFMPGGKAKGSCLVIGSADETWFCEGYATALSIRAALKSLYRKAQVVVCFSAGNIPAVVKNFSGSRYLVADNDKSGTGAHYARLAGIPFVMPPEVGTDANDYHQSAGVFALARLLRDIEK